MVGRNKSLRTVHHWSQLVTSQLCSGSHETLENMPNHQEGVAVTQTVLQWEWFWWVSFYLVTLAGNV